MFERYTEGARRAIFFARYEAGNCASPYIEAEHLLLGILREDIFLRSALPLGSFENIRRRIEAELPPSSEPLATTVDIPMSTDSKRALGYAAEEAQALGHYEFNTGHMVLGILRLENGLAASILKENGISLETYRQQVTQTGNRMPLRRRLVHAEPPRTPPTKLERLIASAAARLDSWSEKEWSQRLLRKSWTRKEALGHLVDYAAAHQQWLAAALAEPKLFARGYPAEEWIAAQRYSDFGWADLVDLWVALNRLLVHVVADIPAAKLSTPCRIGVADPIPLSAVISRYVDYCEDILGQMFVHG